MNMKKIIALLLALGMTASFYGCSSSEDPADDGEKPGQETTQGDEEQKTEEERNETENETEDEAKPESDSIESGRYTLPCGLELSFSTSVRNDTTGNWRISTTASSIVVADYAMEYYETMFSSDEELHAIWNATLKTTTRISVSGNVLFVDTFEYVKGEEHDANKLFTGLKLDSKTIDLDTGKPLEY